MNPLAKGDPFTSCNTSIMWLWITVGTMHIHRCHSAGRAFFGSCPHRVHSNAPLLHTSADMLFTQTGNIRISLDMPEKLQPPLDLSYVSLIFWIETHLIFNGLVRMDHRAVIAAAEVEADRLQ